MSIRELFLISDGTGISVETLAHSIITQFERTKFNIKKYRFIDTEEKAIKIAEKINLKSKTIPERPLVLTTIADSRISTIIANANCYFQDLLQNAINTLEIELGEQANHSIGLSHAIDPESSHYNDRIDAIHYSLNNDDGTANSNYKNADIILIGVSRTGKTPTSLYLAMKYGLRAANVPITTEDFFAGDMPKCITEHKDKVFGLTITPERLHKIRSKRRPDSKYASIQQCELEVEQVEFFFNRENIPFLNSTNLSVEELAARIMERRSNDILS